MLRSLQLHQAVSVGVGVGFWRCYSDEGNRRPEAGQYRSPWTILKTEFNSVRNRKNLTADLPVPRETDALIIGGGAIGSCVAYWLKRDHPKGISVTVVEKDLCVRSSFQSEIVLEGGRVAMNKPAKY